MTDSSILVKLKLENGFEFKQKKDLNESITKNYKLNYDKDTNKYYDYIYVVFYHYSKNYILDNICNYFNESDNYCIFKDIDSAMNYMYLISEINDCITSMYLREFVDTDVTKIMKKRYEIYKTYDLNSKYKKMESKDMYKSFKSYLNDCNDVIDIYGPIFLWNFSYIVDFYEKINNITEIYEATLKDEEQDIKCNEYKDVKEISCKGKQSGKANNSKINYILKNGYKIIKHKKSHNCITTKLIFDYIIDKETNFIKELIESKKYLNNPKTFTGIIKEMIDNSKEHCFKTIHIETLYDIIKAHVNPNEHIVTMLVNLCRYILAYDFIPILVKDIIDYKIKYDLKLISSLIYIHNKNRNYNEVIKIYEKIVEDNNLNDGKDSHFYTILRNNSLSIQKEEYNKIEQICKSNTDKYNKYFNELSFNYILSSYSKTADIEKQFKIFEIYIKMRINKMTLNEENIINLKKIFNNDIRCEYINFDTIIDDIITYQINSQKVSELLAIQSIIDLKEYQKKYICYNLKLFLNKSLIDLFKDNDKSLSDEYSLLFKLITDKSKCLNLESRNVVSTENVF